MADYPYIFGLFKSLEGKLLNPNDIERMVDAKDAQTAFRVFNDTEYADNLLEVEPQEFKKALGDDLKQTRDGVMEAKFPAGSRGKLLFWKVYEASRDSRWHFYGFTVDANMIERK